MRERYFIIGCLIGVLIAPLLYAPLSGSEKLYSLQYGETGTGEYDPWLDINDDGKINVEDSIAIWQAYGTTGDPMKPVVVNHNYKLFSYEVDIPPFSYGVIDVPTAGFSTVTLGLTASGFNPYTETKYLSLSVNYRLQEKYLPVASLSLSIPPMQIELITEDIYAPYVSFNASEIPVGTRFNITVYCRGLSKTYHSYMVYLYYQQHVINMTRAWLPPDSVFSGNQIQLGPIYGRNVGTSKTWGYGAIGAQVFDPTFPFGNVGKLASFEFEIVASPEPGQTFVSPLIIGQDVPEGATYKTWFKDAGGNAIDYTWSNGGFEYYTVTPFDATYSIVKTYEVKGVELRIRYNNPNDFNVTLNVGIYLTTAP